MKCVLCSYFDKVVCDTQITMAVGDHSKRQLITIRFPISRAPI